MRPVLFFTQLRPFPAPSVMTVEIMVTVGYNSGLVSVKIVLSSQYCSTSIDYSSIVVMTVVAAVGGDGFNVG